jgi:hypothetical protein
MAAALSCLTRRDRKAFARRCRVRLAVLQKEKRAGTVTGALVDVRASGGRTDRWPEGVREAEDLLAVTMWVVSGEHSFSLSPSAPDLRRGSDAERAVEHELWVELAEASGLKPATAQVAASLAAAWPGDSPAGWLELLEAARAAVAG